MERLNLVPCKMCNKDFNYQQNISGNARQLCNVCRLIADNLDLEKLEDDTIKEGNRYLVGAPGRKDEYDPVDILIDGNILEFKSDADRFVCAVEIGKFVRSNGFTGMEDNLVKLLESFEITYRILFLKQLPLDQVDMMARDIRFKKLIKDIMKLY